MDCVKQQDNSGKSLLNNKERTLWIHSQSSRPMHAIQRKQPGDMHYHYVYG